MSIGDLGVWFDGETWVVAHSREDAKIVFCEWSGNEWTVDQGEGEFERLSGLLSLYDDGGLHDKNVDTWVASNGRGYLASVNF